VTDQDKKASLLVFAATAVVFLPILGNGFVWDDPYLFAQNAMHHGLGAANLRWMATTFLMGQYRPLGWLLWHFVYRAFGPGPFGYHLVSLLLHAANAALVFEVSRQILRRTSGAVFSALLFATHPLRVESVAWASNGQALAAGLLFLLAIREYLVGRRGAALAAYAASLLCKANGLYLPAILLVLDYVPLRRRERTLVLLEEKAPFIALALAGAAAAVVAQLHWRNLTPLGEHGLAARALQIVYGLGFYLEKTFLPTGLSVLYPLSEVPVGKAVLALLALAAVELGLRRLGVAPRVRWALWAYYGLSLVPFLGILQNGPQLVALRYSYFACMGWTLLAGAGFARAWSAPRLRRAATAGAATLLAAQSAAAWAQMRVWRDDAALWSAAERAEPGSLTIETNLATALMLAGRRDEAIPRLLRVRALDPRADWVLLPLGEAYAGEGLVDEAVPWLRRALEADPRSVTARIFLGAALLQRRELDAAAEQFSAALKADPRSAEAHNGLGSVRGTQGRTREAAEEFQTAVSLAPGNAAFEANLKAARAQGAL